MDPFPSVSILLNIPGGGRSRLEKRKKDLNLELEEENKGLTMDKKKVVGHTFVCDVGATR